MTDDIDDTTEIIIPDDKPINDTVKQITNEVKKSPQKHGSRNMLGKPVKRIETGETGEARKYLQRPDGSECYLFLTDEECTHKQMEPITDPKKIPPMRGVFVPAADLRLI